MNNTTGQTPGITTTSGAADLPEALINIAREIEALKRDCGMDTESAIAIQNGRYMAISSEIRALAAGQATAAQAVVQDDLITIRRPTTRAEMLWLLKLAHLVISDVDKALEETFAPAQPVAPQGATYAALPEPYCNAHDDADACYPDMFSEHQMHAFADATNTLRASHVQAPAEHTRPCVVCGSDEPFTGTCGSGDPRALCKQPTSAQAADSVQEDAARLDFIQECGATVEILPGRLGWTFRVGGLHGGVHGSVRAAIDAERQAFLVHGRPELHATHALRASHGQASSQAGEYPALVCDYCGALTPDPWHSSGMLHGKMSKHIHSCDACAARGVAKAQASREQLTRERIQDLLLCGNPTDEEMRLIRIGWDAAHGIKGGQHGDATPQPTQPDPAYSAACNLATALFKKHFAHLPDFASGQAVWSLCDSTAGVISQIDNMVAGLVQPPTTSPQADSVQEDAARYRFLRDGEWRDTDLEPFIRLQLNTLWDAKIDAARAARGAAQKEGEKT